MLDVIRKQLRSLEYDALLVTSPSNRRYVTGFPSSAGVAVLTETKGYFFTDSRYIEAAERSVKGFQVEESSRETPYPALVNRVIREHRIKTIALEADHLTYASYCKWKEDLAAETVPAGDVFAALRTVKSRWEKEQIRKAQAIAEKAFEAVLPAIRAGATEQEIAAALCYQMLRHGAERMSFDPIVVAGEKSSMPHGTPDGNVVRRGDFVTMDFGCMQRGYCSDMTRTVAVEEASEEMRQVYETVLAAQNAGIQTVRAGVPAAAPDQAARRIIEDAGYGAYFGHGFGHGVGLEIHEGPVESPASGDMLAAGNVVTAEPGIYLPGNFGVRIEDMLYITEDGCENLTKTPKDLIILP